MTSKAKTLSFFAVVALFWMAASFAHPVTPVLIKTLKLEDYMFGLSLACMMFGNFLFSPFWGKVSTYISSRNTLLVSCVGYGVGQVFFALSQTTAQFLMARFFAGVFCGGIFVGILTYIVGNAPDEKARSKFLVMSATIEAVFNSMGYFVGGMLGEIGVYVAVVAQAITLVACGLLFRAVCGGDGAQKQAANAGAGALVKEVNPFRAFAQGKVLLLSSMGALFVVCALQYFSQTAYDQTFNYYVIDQIGLSTGYNGLIKFVMSMVTFAANATLCVWLMRRSGLWKSVVGVLSAATLSMVGILFLKDLAPFLCVNVLFFALSSITTPMTQNLVASAGKAYDSNLVMGFYNSLKSFGGILGALVAGFTYVLSPKMPFIACVVGFALAVLLTFSYGKRMSVQKAESVTGGCV